MGRLQKVMNWLRKRFGKKRKQDDFNTAVLENYTAPTDICDTGRSPSVDIATDASYPNGVTGSALFSDDVTGPTSSSDDVTGPTLFPDDVTSPTSSSDDVTGPALITDDVTLALFPILLASSLHMRRAARRMSLAEIGRRKLDIKVSIAKCEDRSADHNCREKVTITIADRYGPTVTHHGHILDVGENRWERVKNAQYEKESTILYTPLAYSRIRNLDIEYLHRGPTFYVWYLLCSGLLLNIEAPICVENLSFPLCGDAMQLCDYVSAERVVLKNTPDENGFAEIEDFVFSRAMLDARFIEIENVWEIEYHFQLLMTPNIYLMQRTAIPDDYLYRIIKQWQSGRREIETFCGRVITTHTNGFQMPDFLTDTHGQEFNKRLREAIPCVSETPYPSDDVIPSLVHLQLETIEEHRGTIYKSPRSFVIGRDRDESCLVVLEKALKGKTVAVGIFHK